MTGNQQQQEIMVADGPSTALLAEHPRCEPCRLCGDATTPATVAFPREQAAEEPSVPYTIEAHHPLCDWCAKH